ncbi:MAG: WG repeat-containing protein [Planctomycetota bacterium]
MWCLGSALGQGFPDEPEHFYARVETGPVAYGPASYTKPLNLLPIQLRGGWGYADRRGRVVIEPRRQWTDYFYPIKSGEERRGREKLPRLWAARVLESGRCLWLRGINHRGGISLPPEEFRNQEVDFRRFDRLVRNHFVVWKKNGEDVEYGLRAEERGEGRGQPLEVKYAGVLRPHDDFVAFQEGELCGYAYRTGDVMIEPRFAVARSFYQNVAAVRLTEAEGGRWAFIQKNEKFVFVDRRGEIEELRNFRDGLAAVKAGGRWGFMDRRFKVVIRPIYDEVRDFSVGYAAVRRGGEWSYLNVAGRTMADGFEEAYPFEDPERSGLLDVAGYGAEKTLDYRPLALIKRGGLYGFIDVVGNVVIEPQFRNATPFFRGVARVALGESFGYIDAGGRLVWDPRRAERYGIDGWELGEQREKFWPGLPGPDGAAEPFPFEYEIDDVLPINRTRRPETSSQDTSSERSHR